MSEECLHIESAMIIGVVGLEPAVLVAAVGRQRIHLVVGHKNLAVGLLQPLCLRYY